MARRERTFGPTDSRPIDETLPKLRARSPGDLLGPCTSSSYRMRLGGSIRNMRLIPMRATSSCAVGHRGTGSNPKLTYKQRNELLNVRWRPTRGRLMLELVSDWS